MKSIAAFAVILLIVFAAPAVGILFPPGAWHAGLVKPPLNPPNWVFGPVWTMLYLAQAVAAWLLWRRRAAPNARAALALFAVQLLLNALWTPLFFGLHSTGAALADIILLWIAICATMSTSFRIDRRAGALLVPYLAWVSFATYLNFTFWRLNP